MAHPQNLVPEQALFFKDRSRSRSFPISSRTFSLSYISLHSFCSKKSPITSLFLCVFIFQRSYWQLFCRIFGIFFPYLPGGSKFGRPILIMYGKERLQWWVWACGVTIKYDFMEMNSVLCSLAHTHPRLNNNWDLSLLPHVHSFRYICNYQEYM